MFKFIKNAVCGVRRIATPTYKGFYIYPYNGKWEYAETEYKFMKTLWGVRDSKEECKKAIDEFLSVRQKGGSDAL